MEKATEVPNPSPFGSIFSFMPSDGCLEVGGFLVCKNGLEWSGLTWGWVGVELGSVGWIDGATEIARKVMI